MRKPLMRVAPAVVLDIQQRKTLEQWAKSRSLPMRQVQRARIILLAADGKQDLEIAAEVNVSNQKASRWRKRFLKDGFPGLEKDAPRPGRRPTITPAKIQDVIRKTTREKPDNATHWSTRTMAQAAGISEKSVRRIWHQHGLKPHLTRTFKVSNDPQFAEKLEAIIGLSLNPPEHAIVLCADEKSQIQALDRTQPGLPLKKGRCGTMTHDCWARTVQTIKRYIGWHDVSRAVVDWLPFCHGAGLPRLDLVATGKESS